MPVSKSKYTFLSGLCTIIKISIEGLLILMHCIHVVILPGFLLPLTDSCYHSLPPAIRLPHDL